MSRCSGAGEAALDGRTPIFVHHLHAPSRRGHLKDSTSGCDQLPLGG